MVTIIKVLNIFKIAYDLILNNLTELVNELYQN